MRITEVATTVRAACIVCGLLSFSALLGAPPHNTVDHSTWRLKLSGEAKLRACRLIGLTGEQGSRMDTSLVTLTQDNTPFLSDSLVGRDLWHIRLRDWSFELKSVAEGYKDTRNRTADIYLDPIDGRLLKLKTHWAKGERKMPPEVSAKVGAEQMLHAGHERYHGFPTEDPKISFLDALDSIFRWGDDPFAARQVVAHYVMWSRMEREPRPVWAVMLRGVPVIKPIPGTPDDALDQYTYIVDAETGQLMLVTNTPRPERPLAP